MSPAASDLQEWIVEQYRRKCAKEKSRADACSTSDLVRQFRHKFKIDIQFAIAAGLGAMIQAAGQPWGALGLPNFLGPNTTFFDTVSARTCIQ